MAFTSIQIERFKREAKQLRRVSPLSHSHALDQIANANGFGNWSLLMKHSAPDGAPAAASSRPPFRFLRSPEQMRQALRKVATLSDWDEPGRTELAKQQVEDISQSLISPKNAVSFAIAYMSCLLERPRFKVYSAAPAYWEMRAWLPYACKEVDSDSDILVNRSYKPVGTTDSKWANYVEFPHLHVRLSGEQRQSFAARPSSPNYLFNDGCAPWHSRANAVAYLERLRRLEAVLNS